MTKHSNSFINFEKMKVDYIVVGLGLAGLCFIETLKKHNKTFIVFENESQTSSRVAAGMFNPVVLKRFTSVWKGKEQLELAIPFFQKLEKQFSKKYIHYIDIYRIFKSVEEQNNWFLACDNDSLSTYMTLPLLLHDNESVIAPFGYGKLTGTGKIDVKLVLQDYADDLSLHQSLRKEAFIYSEVVHKETSIKYKDIEASKIVFCEGFGMKLNPFFNTLPMNEAKGELLTIHAPDLKINYMLKAAVFVLPLGNDLYKVGATFNWKDKTVSPTEDGKNELIKKLEATTKTPYIIVEHTAGIRPTVKDRRPLLGIHHDYENIAILNGLGTRGVMLGPTMAKKLYDFLEKNIALDKEITINRFC